MSDSPLIQSTAFFFLLFFPSLSVCEKALAEYLETKRLAFPRFYFVSSADLLDILSKGNLPAEVQSWGTGPPHPMGHRASPPYGAQGLPTLWGTGPPHPMGHRASPPYGAQGLPTLWGTEPSHSCAWLWGTGPPHSCAHVAMGVLHMCRLPATWQSYLTAWPSSSSARTRMLSPARWPLGCIARREST